MAVRHIFTSFSADVLDIPERQQRILIVKDDETGHTYEYPMDTISAGQMAAALDGRSIVTANSDQMPNVVGGKPKMQ